MNAGTHVGSGASRDWRNLLGLYGVCREMIHLMRCGGMAMVAVPGDVVCRRWR